MVVRSLFTLALLVMLAGCDQRPAKTEPEAKAHPVRYDRAADGAPRCAAGERRVYSCAFKQKTVSVCATDRTVTYRYGAANKTDLTIVSDGADGKAHATSIRGPGRGGFQTSLRFSNQGYEYIVYSAIGGADTEVAGRRWSGLVVMKGGDQVSNQECPTAGPGQRFTLDTAPSFIPDETNPEFEAWY
ncbi:hypothetical protein [Caulobacter sp. RL271]|jgi:hypothetical protein|uniref:Lipoprotein n=1 Tax=Caulobacter segnis TaxID=88688 RepID=A0ABY4ZYK1_9CAUL|nr:hypothetical protein [Caulobacter segnis]USQ96996.1 hypothetical protein MZV50_05380 [Caulobacter segnis]